VRGPLVRLRVWAVALVVAQIVMAVAPALARAQEPAAAECSGILESAKCKIAETAGAVDLPEVSAPDIDLPEVNLPGASLPEGWRDAISGEWPPGWWPETLPEWLPALPENPTPENLEAWWAAAVATLQEQTGNGRAWLDTQTQLLGLAALAFLTSESLRTSAVRVVPRASRVVCAAAPFTAPIGGGICLATRLLTLAIAVTLGLDTLMTLGEQRAVEPAGS
jgi:hypothetical protein